MLKFIHSLKNKKGPHRSFGVRQRKEQSQEGKKLPLKIYMGDHKMSKASISGSFPLKYGSQTNLMFLSPL